MRRYQRFLLLCVSLGVLVALAAPPSRACWGPLGPEPAFDGGDRMSFLEFGLAGDPLYRDFYYYAICDHGYPAAPPPAPPDLEKYRENLAEWAQYAHGAPIEDVYQAVYKSNRKSLADLARLMTAGGAAADWRSLFGANAFIKDLVDRGDHEALAYLVFAKDCEPYAALADPWAPVPARDPEKMRALIDEGLKQYGAARGAFIKLRYAYQIVRLANYAKLYADCAAYYDRLVPGLQGESVIRYWALRQKAGALQRLGRKADALLLTALIFDQCPSLMGEALRDFRLPAQDVWREMLAAVTNKHRQATLWFMRALKEPRLEIEPLRQLYALEPASARLEVLLIRQTNRVEEEILRTGRFFGAPPRGGDGYERGLALAALSREGAASGRVRQPALWHLAAGYLSFLTGRDAEAEQSLTRAAGLAKAGELHAQITLVQTLTALARAEKPTPALAQAAATALAWTGTLNKAWQNQAIHRSLLVLLAQEELAAGRTSFAAACLDTAGYELSRNVLLDLCADEGDLAGLIDLAAKPGKSAYETAVLKGLTLSPDELREIRGTKLLRAGRYGDALAEFRRIGASYWTKKREWPLRTVFTPPAGLRPPVNDKKLQTYTKLAFAEHVTTLLAKAAKEPKQAAACWFQLGNAFYHSPYWGYNEVLWHGGMVTFLNYLHPDAYPFDLPGYGRVVQTKREEFAKAYGGAAQAVKYYALAAKAADDREQAALCTYMAAQAAVRPVTTLKGRETRDGGAFVKALKEEYGGTRFYKEIVKECPGVVR